MSINEKSRWSALLEVKECFLMSPITLHFSPQLNGAMLLPFLFRAAKISSKIGSIVTQLMSSTVQEDFS
jgi:hypothetical protein